MNPSIALPLLVMLLQFAGVFTATAFLAMFLPEDWMATTHEWLGLGEFPRSPIVNYLARSLGALYGFHGILLLIVSSDPIRYRRIVMFVAVMNIVLGLLLIAIGVHAGLPIYWILAEGPPIVAFGGVVTFLAKGLKEPRGEHLTSPTPAEFR